MYPIVPASSVAAQGRLDFKAEGEDGFGAYHDLYAAGSTVSRLGPTFRAAVTAHRFPGFLMFERSIAGAVHHREEARVRHDGLDHFNLQMLRNGRMAAGLPGEERPMRPGDIVVFDTTRPQRTVVDGADYVVLSLSRDAVEAALPDARRLHGVVLPRRAAGLLGDFVLSLLRNAPTLSVDLAALGGDMVVGLLAGAAGGVAGAEPDAASDDAFALHRARAEIYIDAHLSDPTLDADGIAAALGLSRSALYRAFARTGGVARRITARRVDRMRAALRRPGEQRSIAALSFALGFGSESHCSRAFKAAYGIAPGQFRAGAYRSDGRPTGGFGDWLCELR